MDSGSGIGTANIDLSKLTDRDKQELQAFITNETQVSLSATALQTSRLILYSESKNPTMLVLSCSSCLPQCLEYYSILAHSILHCARKHSLFRIMGL